MSKYWLLIGQSDSFIRTDNTYAHNAKRLRKLLLILSSRLILELTLLFNCFILINKMPGSNLNFLKWLEFCRFPNKFDYRMECPFTINGNRFITNWTLLFFCFFKLIFNCFEFFILLLQRKYIWVLLNSCAFIWHFSVKEVNFVHIFWCGHGFQILSPRTLPEISRHVFWCNKNFLG